MPDRKRLLSPILLESHGMHHGPKASVVFPAIKPFFLLSQQSKPKPLPFWFSLHAPAANKPVEMLETQGPAAILDFNYKMRDVLEASENGLDEPPVVVDYYPMTLGARSFDGSHYSLQVCFACLSETALSSVTGEP
jgi:hypothetical protein